VARAPFTSLPALAACLCATAAIGVSPAAASTACPNANLTPNPGNVAQVRAAVLCLIDQERERHGEGALASNAKLTRAAQQHSRDMASEDYFSHVAPDGQTPLLRMRSSGYLSSSSQEGYVVGENIAWGTLWLATPQAIVSAWMASPGHRANILDGAFRETGVGVEPRPPASLAEGQAGALYTQDFGAIVAPGHSARRSVPGSLRSGSASGSGRSGRIHRAHHQGRHRHHRRKHRTHRRHGRSRRRS
jgi:uncharacterized protein YkwD